ncbi:nuclear transport factor 2 family protein [Aeromicrobium sp. Sec7.5]|uniref:nuclear transport factor 2 family protein n=1 Tax=Aeromicrobium sp. Sec7.5 TaxID=3121276 RepID=UPI002FE48C30
MPSQNQPEAAMQAYFAALATHDDSVLRDCFTDDAIWVAPGLLPNSGTWAGSREIVEQFFPIASARMRLETLSTTVLSLTYGDDNAVVEWETTVETVEGGTYENRYIANFIVRGSKVAEVREYFDTQRGQTLFA